MHVAIKVGTDGKVFRYVTLTVVCLLCLRSEGFKLEEHFRCGFQDVPLNGCHPTSYR